MLIGEFSIKSGLSIDTLRYYDRMGLLTPKRKNKRREYSEEDLQRARGVQILKKAGFSLNEIKQLLDIDRKIDLLLNNKELEDDLNPLLFELEELIQIKYDILLKKEEEIIRARKMLKYFLDKVSGAREVFQFKKE